MMPSLPVVVVYRDPTDFPGRYVARRQWVRGGDIEVELNPLTIGDTLEEARSVVPPGMVRIERHASDEPQIVESWI